MSSFIVLKSLNYVGLCARKRALAACTIFFLFNQKKKASESHRLLVETYGEHAPSIKTCETWFRQFKIGDFDVKDKERSGRRQKFDDEELQELLDEDPTQSQQKLAEA